MLRYALPALVCFAGLSGAAHADTMTFAVDIPYTTCTSVSAASYVTGTACGRTTGTITLSRGTIASVYTVTALELDSYITGDWTRTARYTYGIAGEADDALTATATTIYITTSDVFTPPANYAAIGLDSWVSPEETTLTLSHGGSGVIEGDTQMVLAASTEAYGRNEYTYNPYGLRAEDDLDVGATAFDGGLVSLAGYTGNMRGQQNVPGVTLAEATATASDVPLPGAAPLLLGALAGLVGLRRARG